MRKHRRYEFNSGKKLTVQVPTHSLREIVNMLSSDIEVDIKARAGIYGNGSEDFPIPRTMSISRLSNMTPTKSIQPIEPIESVPSAPEPASVD